MQHGPSAWVTVRHASEQTGVAESRLRAAYRRGELAVIDDLVAGRRCKLLNVDEVELWAGLTATAAGSSPDDDRGRALTTRLEEIAAQVDRALDRAGRAEQQVAYLRNEVAQLRAAHSRVQEIVDDRSLAAFRDVTGAVAATVVAPRPRRRFLGRTWRVSA